ncbi:MAG: hypothetical protein L0332_10665 [Chloroflexi bacterium]|nr:hypothetical protein [Chloroflexota bacterium]MCI0576129.1 hypothetical protein [Chloroflexota bacterium]MCI0647917.1 hypothetical protein [Chloroflexota bacterium]MCI0727168.1 hypothetical protein [Chloroflexota bacterium]
MSSESEPILAPRRRRFVLRPRHLVLLAIVLLAAGLRLWRLDTLPPGLYHDEAYDAMDALSLTQGEAFPLFYEGWELYADVAHENRPVQQTQFPIFFEGNYGREPLHMYLMALSITLFGLTPFAVRLVPALSGVLAVLTTYLAAKALLNIRNEATTDDEAAPDGEPRFLFLPGPHLVPLLAALALAVLYPAITFSRFGIRAMLFVPVETLAVYCFWQGINRAAARRTEAAEQQQFRLAPFPTGPAGLRWFILAGFWLGLSIYTYAAARLLPLLFASFIFIWFWRDRQALRYYWRQMLAMALTSLVIALPLLLFFARYPYFFIFRSRYVANRGLGTYPGRPLLTWFYNIGRVFQGLFWLGETHLRHNLPGRPFMDPIQAFFFSLGLLSMVARWWQRQRRLQLRDFFLLLWLVVMLLPSILSGDAPHFGRMVGAGPPVAILVGMGAHWLWQGLARRLGGEGQPGGEEVTRQGAGVLSRAGLAWLLLAVFGLSAFLTVRDYFGRYAAHPDLPAAFDLPEWQLGKYALALPGETTIYLTPTQEEMVTIFFALEGQWSRLRSYYSPEGLIPAGQPGRPVAYLVRPPATNTLPRLAAFFPAGTAESPADDFVAFRVPAVTPRVLAEQATDVTWEGAIALRGWSALQAEDRLLVTLYWQAEVQVMRSYTVFVHLLDQDGELVTQLDRPPEGYLTSDWRPEEIVADTYTLLLPDGLPPGKYTLQTGFYYLPTQERLGDVVVLGNVDLR